MLSFHYNLTTYSGLVQELARFFSVPITDYMIQIPSALGAGFFKVIDFDNGIEGLIYNLRLHDDLLLTRQKNNKEFYTLILDEVENVSGVMVTIEREKMTTDIDRTDALYLTSFLFDIETVLFKNINIKGLRVLLNLPWMQRYLNVKDNEEVMLKYINLKAKGIWYKTVDSESRELLHEVLNQQNASLLSYQNKIMRIVEKFFVWLYDETKTLGEKTGISRQDIENAQKVEAILTSEKTVIAPTISELAKTAAMSESKLKKIFKAVYGLPVYEYFQRHRMQKARLMLLSGKYAIKDVGYTLGYSNLSNFTLAFKKAFGRLPSELMK